MLKQFDYTDREARENTISGLFADAQNERQPYELWWRTFDNYYDGYQQKIEDLNQKMDEYEAVRKATNYVALTDPFIQVESQIDPNFPDAVFYPRDKNADKDKAKQREYVVKYICSINDLKSKNTASERSLRKYGDSIYKVYWDDNKVINGKSGEIGVARVNIDDFFPDPTAKNIEDCEYIDYCYYMHKRKASRVFKAELKKAKLKIEEIASEDKSTTQSVSDTAMEHRDNEIQVLEHWYKDDDGDICLSVLLGGKEIKYIEKYWKRTGGQNKNYPFVHLYRLKDERRFWSLSEIKTIIPLINAANRILNAAIENTELLGNDVWLIEDGSLDENAEITNEAGLNVTYKKGSRLPQRAQGLNALRDYIADIVFFQGQIERTLRNYDTNQGKETARTSTASGLAQLRADAQTQGKIKDYDRMQGYKRLFKMIDWMGLEFYDDNRLIFIGVPEYENEAMGAMNLDKKKGDIYFRFNSEDLREPRLIMEEGNVAGEEFYYPDVDCEVRVSNEIEKSKSFTVQVLQSLMATQITPENYKIAIKLLDELEIPQTDEIIDDLKKRFENNPIFTPEIQEFIKQLPPEQQQQVQAKPELAYIAYIQATKNNAGTAQKSNIKENV